MPEFASVRVRIRARVCWGLLAATMHCRAPPTRALEGLPETQAALRVADDAVTLRVVTRDAQELIRESTGYGQGHNSGHVRRVRCLRRARFVLATCAFCRAVFSTQVLLSRPVRGRTP